MVVFQNTPEYETRRTLMISLQNQLVVSLSSALIAAINSHDNTLCRSYYSIFAHIQRDSEFRAYYFGSRRSSLVGMWQDVNPSDTGGLSASHPELSQFVRLKNLSSLFLLVLRYSPKVRLAEVS